MFYSHVEFLCLFCFSIVSAKADVQAEIGNRPVAEEVYESLFDDLPTPSPDDDVSTTEPEVDQMSSEWWDIHYSAIFKRYKFKIDKAEDLIRWGDLQDWRYHNTALQQVQNILNLPEMDASVKRKRPVIVVLGCGLAPLVFLIAKLDVADVHCVDISVAVVKKLQEFSDQLPRSVAPSFHAADLTNALSTFHNGTVDYVVDETVLDSMACKEPRGSGAVDQGLLLSSVSRWLRPQGKLLTLSYLPLSFDPHLEAPFDKWALLQEHAATEETPLHAALWEKKLHQWGAWR